MNFNRSVYGVSGAVDRAGHGGPGPFRSPGPAGAARRPRSPRRPVERAPLSGGGAGGRGGWRGRPVGRQRSLPLFRAPQNAGIFGAAKPREAVLAERAGVREEDVLAKEAASEDLKIRLTPEQSRIKRDAEAEIEGLRKQVDEVQDVSERARVVAEIDQKERELEEMMRQFEEMAVQNAREGKYQVGRGSALRGQVSVARRNEPEHPPASARPLQSVRAQQAQRNAIQGSGDPFGGPASFDGFPAYPDEREFGYGRGRGGRGGGGGRGRGRMGPGPGGYGGGSGWEQEGGFPDMGFPPPAAFDGGRGFGGGRGFYDAPDQGAGYVAPMGGGGFDSFNGVRGRGRGRRNGNGGGYNGG